MSTEQGFLNQLAVEPGDEVTRLVYADWLEDQGDPRAAYLRAETELAGLTEDDPRYAELNRTVSEQAAALPEEWLAVAGRKWDVWLLGYEPIVIITVIKAIRDLVGCGLKVAKHLAEAVPSCVQSSLPRSTADTMRRALADIRSAIAEPESRSSVRAVLRRTTSPVPALSPGRLSTDTYDVRLLSYPALQKIAVIKAIRELTGCSLVHAKTLAESLPVALAQSVDAATAERIRAAFLGLAIVEVR